VPGVFSTIFLNKKGKRGSRVATDAEKLEAVNFGTIPIGPKSNLLTSPRQAKLTLGYGKQQPLAATRDSGTEVEKQGWKRTNDERQMGE
jgi:hypothetical protein